MSGDGYRCDACRHRTQRCKACRARRAGVVNKRRANRRKQRLCIMCGRKAAVVWGVQLTRCKDCSEDNRVRSLASHSKRARGGEA